MILEELLEGLKALHKSATTANVLVRRLDIFEHEIDHVSYDDGVVVIHVDDDYQEHADAEVDT